MAHASRARSRPIARWRFSYWDRSASQRTVIPVGRWRTVTADSVLLRCWPPGPEPRLCSISRSASRSARSKREVTPSQGDLAGPPILDHCSSRRPGHFRIIRLPVKCAHRLAPLMFSRASNSVGGRNAPRPGCAPYGAGSEHREDSGTWGRCASPDHAGPLGAGSGPSEAPSENSAPRTARESSRAGCSACTPLDRTGTMSPWTGGVTTGGATTSTAPISHPAPWGRNTALWA